MSKTIRFRDDYDKLPKKSRKKIDREIEEDLRNFRSIDMAFEQYLEDEEEVSRPKGDR